MRVAKKNKILTPDEVLSAAAREVQRRREIRNRCQNDLLEFIRYTHPSWEDANHHALMCTWLMKLEAQEITKLAIFAPPRHGKSEIVSRRFPAWCMGRNPHWETICIQASLQLSQDMGRDVRDIIASPEYKEIFPDVGLKADAKAAGRWVIDNPHGHDGVYFSGSITNKIIGRGANLLNIDDPLDKLGAFSPRQRQLAADRYFGDAIMRLMSPGLQLITTTRRHEDGLEGRILPPESEWEPTDDPRVFRAPVNEDAYSEPEVWWVIVLKAIENEGTDEEKALWPGVNGDRFPLSRLKAVRSRLMKSGNANEWYSQYQQEITPEEGNFCKRDWYKERYEEVPSDLWIYATSDVAVTDENQGGNPDFTEHCIYGLEGLQMEYGDDGKQIVTADSVYILDWWSGQRTPDVWIEELIKLFKKWNPQCWFGTKGTIRNSIETYLARELRLNRTWVRTEWLNDMASKAAKGRPLQGMSSAGRVLFPKTAWAERVIQQICTFPKGMKDDAFDAMANVVRSMGEIPEAFIGAPVVSTRQRRDSWSFSDEPNELRSWRIA